jgi:hypothetical protein
MSWKDILKTDYQSFIDSVLAPKFQEGIYKIPIDSPEVEILNDSWQPHNRSKTLGTFNGRTVITRKGHEDYVFELVGGMKPKTPKPTQSVYVARGPNE